MKTAFQGREFASFVERLVLSACPLCAGIAVEAQVAFSNFDFESASFIPPSPGYALVDFPQALPYWKGYCGTVEQTKAVYNDWGLASPGICIFDTNYSRQYFHDIPIQNNYGVFLQSGFGPLLVETSISQTGQIPLNAQTLIFNSHQPSSSVLQITFAGTNLPIYLLSVKTNYEVYACNVVPFSGQLGLLKFAVSGSGTALFLDSLLFSSYPLQSELTVKQSQGGVALSWPFKTYPALVQESQDPIFGPWTVITNKPTGDGSFWYLTLPPPTGNRYYRLISQ